MTCLLDAYEDGDTSPAARLADRMSDLSEECYFAGWLIGTEYALWELAQAGGGRWGIGVVMPEQAAELIDLANKAGGWVAWRDGVGCVFVPMAEWLAECARVARKEASQ